MSGRGTIVSIRCVPKWYAVRAGWRRRVRVVVRRRGRNGSLVQVRAAGSGFRQRAAARFGLVVMSRPRLLKFLGLRSL